jgi:valyl-tRNA synthetase
MIRVLDYVLRLLHPFTPFVTEELFNHLKAAAQSHSDKLVPEDGVWPEALIIAPWPQAGEKQDWEDPSIRDFSQLQGIVRAIRNARAEKNVKPGQKIPATIVAGAFAHMLEHEVASLATLSRIDPEQLAIYKELAVKPADCIVLVVGGTEIFLPLAGMVDLAEERSRMEKELAEAESQTTRLEKLLNSPFAEKAPEQVVQNEREKLEGFKETAEKLRDQLAKIA